MDWLLLVKRTFSVSIIALAGCNSAQLAGFTNNGNAAYLAASLINDIEEGRLDMPFERACLIASGVDTEKKMQSYLSKIEYLISLINQETCVNKTDDPLVKAKTVFDWLHRNANEGTYNDCYDIRDTLNLKVGNCLSYAIRFTVVCRYYAIDIKNIYVPGHIYNMLASNGQEYYFEHTHSDGIVKNADRNSPQKKVMTDLELVAEIFLYKARNSNNDIKYEESIKNCQSALMCNPNDSRAVILLLDNYISNKNYDEALCCLNDYISRHPDDRKSFEKSYNILRKLCIIKKSKF